MAWIELFLKNSYELALLSAPWLVIGLFFAGLIRAWLPLEVVGRQLGGSGPGHIFKAALIGAPLPLCSCGTLPAALSLRRSGASRASTTSFLIATPETGVDSVALTWVLLGPLMAVLRPLAAIISAVSAGLLVGRTERETAAAMPDIATQAASCGGSSCGCGDEPPPSPVREGLWQRTLNGQVYAFTEMLDDIALWILGGILGAGVVLTLVPPDFLSSWGSGLGAMLLILVVSVPMYVCATASTPLAHAMLFAGVSPGTVLVFLLAGPASNVASLALVKRELGTRAMGAYLFGVAGMSVILGLVLDSVIGAFELDAMFSIGSLVQQEEDIPALLAVFSLLLLVVLSIRPFRRYLGGGKVNSDGGCCG
jgi:uncharacterized membrane protein YraQ (UPF0718 family)